MRLINITKGKQVIVDDESFDYLNQFHWYFTKVGYASRRLKTKFGDKQHKILMHREIMKETISKFQNKKLTVDHINHNRLDNRKENLRLVTQSINCLNGSMRTTNKSGIIGVCQCHKKGRIKKDGSRTVWIAWQATVTINYKQIHLGFFKTKEEAGEKRKKYMRDNNYLC